MDSIIQVVDLEERSKCNEFGEKEMKGWWQEKDYIGFIKEDVIAVEESLEDIVERIYRTIIINQGGCHGDSL